MKGQAGRPAASPRGRRRRTRRQIRIGAALLVLIYVVGLVATFTISSESATEQSLTERLAPPGRDHLLGTDQYGRDLLARTLLAISVDFHAVLLAVAVAVVIGVPLGVLIGMGGPWFDRVTMRVVDAFLSIPTLVVVMVAVASLGQGLVNTALGVGFSFSLIYARIARTETLNIKNEPFVMSARQSGVGRARLVGRHIMPTLARPLIVETAVILRAGFMLQATLSYFGLSVQPPHPSLGNLLRDAQEAAVEAPWQVLPAGLVLVAIILLLNLTSDGISDLLAVSGTPRRLLDGARGRLSRLPEVSSGSRSLVIESVTIQVDEGAVVRDVSIHLERGEVVALVGESGSGKTMTAMSAAGLLPPGAEIVAGQVQVNGHDLVGASPGLMRSLRSADVGVIFQNPISAMNPTWRVEKHLTFPSVVLRGLTREQARQRAVDLLGEVGIADPEGCLRKYPHELSGGIAQRVMIAAALAGEPSVIIADEPTSALDSTVQVRVLDLLLGLRATRHFSLLLITHSMGVVAHAADRVYVMYSGEIVESGAVSEVLGHPEHPYTQALLAAVPQNRMRERELKGLSGSVPRPTRELPGCRFAERCPHVAAACTAGRVPFVERHGHASRCLRAQLESDVFAVEGRRGDLP
ncbi:oligopeptide/dipeptide ABC transporter ATP-binding protein [Nocardioides soli]|uniref:Peptide/nickel transport system permease protein n=1 Tax=Nocardioides soli TaxID=1036020 RepID=A0A7W4VY17_9ACTN|nr:peptide/nickel transport system permease protein [Nocardioides soli]